MKRVRIVPGDHLARGERVRAPDRGPGASSDPEEGTGGRGGGRARARTLSSERTEGDDNVAQESSDFITRTRFRDPRLSSRMSLSSSVVSSSTETSRFRRPARTIGSNLTEPAHPVASIAGKV